MNNFSGPSGGPSTGDLGMHEMSFLPPRGVKVSRVFPTHKEITENYRNDPRKWSYLSKQVPQEASSEGV